MNSHTLYIIITIIVNTNMPLFIIIITVIHFVVVVCVSVCSLVYRFIFLPKYTSTQMSACVSVFVIRTSRIHLQWIPIESDCIHIACAV